MRLGFARTVVAAAMVVAAATPRAQTSADGRVSHVMATAAYKAAVAALDAGHAQLVADIVTLTEIPAPPFKEGPRGAAFAAMLRQLNLSDVAIDAEGNVTGLRRGSGPAGGPVVAIAAHLDTVFPEGTDTKVKREGTRLSAPGIGDDTRSLAVLLAIVRALDAAHVRTERDILFIGNVGEEGPGDLRGMKYLFQKSAYKDRIKTFLSMDGTGAGDQITNGALGSKRYRVTFKGPGGHSYGAFGLVSPAFALARAIDKLGAVKVPASPKTTFNVGVMGGGTSVNSIPFENWMEVDMRSESRPELEKLTETFLGFVHAAADEENRARSTAQGKIEVDAKLIGDRPSGETPKNSDLVQVASMSIRAAGLTPSFNISSTDSNIPISLGIPAITIDSGGRGGREHALDEWIDVEKTASLRGITVALTTLLTLAGVQ